MSLFNKNRNTVKSSSGRGKKVIIVAGLMLGFMCLAPAMNNSAVDGVLGIETAYASVQQTDRWEASGGDVWRLKTADKSGYVSNSWFQDLDSSWYMIGADGSMLSGLITDASTGKSYLMNVQHDGTFGKMLTVDGVYSLNGINVYLTFNQNHDGSYGAITSGLSEARSAGIAEKQLGSIPTDSASVGGSAGGTPAPATPQGGTGNGNQNSGGNGAFAPARGVSGIATGETGLRN